MGLPYFLVGATARDLLLKHVFGIAVIRGTKDLDFAVAVRSWDEYEALKGRLLETAAFQSGPVGVPHRIQYVENGAKDPVDLLPFGGVESVAATIAWPPDMKILMNVIAYDDALASAIAIKLDDTTNVHVASLPGLALLKLFAWADRGPENPKDALDLATLFRNYPYAGNMDRIYEEALDVLEQVNYDVDIVGPRLLGRDIRQIAREASLIPAIELLNEPTRRELLALHMAKEFAYAEDSLATAQNYIREFTLGLEGR